LVGDAQATLEMLGRALGEAKAPPAWTQAAIASTASWRAAVHAAIAPTNVARPSDAQVIGAVQRATQPDAVLVAAAGGLPGELHKLWQTSRPGGYHLEYGYSTMGYEIAGALGAKMALPARDVVVMLGDGSWLMMNSEIATSVMLGLKLTVVLLDNGGYGCIDRLQRASGGESFNNLLATARHAALPEFDFAAQARGLGAIGMKVAGLAELEKAVVAARDADRTTVIVIDTDPAPSTEAGGHWWDVGIPEVSGREAVRAAREGYETQRIRQRLGD
jgi:3D-(3,5/4)-trihydroxycyclohexane-1,2-dione acylhydrolase (decyclizing)